MNNVDYTFGIVFRGRRYQIDVVGLNVAITGVGMSIIEVQNEYTSLRRYIEDEGFIREADINRGIYNILES